MPCSGEHLKPTAYERESQHMCQNIIYLSGVLQLPVVHWAIDGAESIYGTQVKRDHVYAALCSLCKRAGDDVIYNGRIQDARHVANWWDAHKAADEAKERRQEESAYALRDLAHASHELAALIFADATRAQLAPHIEKVRNLIRQAEGGA
jgi:hypothetical protein